MTTAILEEYFGDYSRSLLDFLHNEKPMAVIMDTQENYPTTGVKGAAPRLIPEGVAMALRLDKTEKQDEFGLKFYFNDKEVVQHGRGLAFWKSKPAPEIFESPVVLCTAPVNPYHLGEWVIVVTKNRDPQKSTLAMLHIERIAASNARFIEAPRTNADVPNIAPIPVQVDPPKPEKA